MFEHETVKFCSYFLLPCYILSYRKFLSTIFMCDANVLYVFSFLFCGQIQKNPRKIIIIWLVPIHWRKYTNPSLSLFIFYQTKHFLSLCTVCGCALARNKTIIIGWEIILQMDGVFFLFSSFLSVSLFGNAMNSLHFTYIQKERKKNHHVIALLSF